MNTTRDITTNIPDVTAKHARYLDGRLVHLLTLVAIAVIIYSNSFQAPFVFDDETQISDNPVIRSLANFFVNSSGYGYNANRFIGHLTFALNYHFGGLNVTGYHAVNLVVHIANALLIYCLVRLTFRTPFLRKSALAPRRGILGLAAALLFVSHPIQTQAVTYIVQRLASLATMFYLAALVLHVRWRLASESREPFLSRAVLPAFLFSLTAALLAMKTKEIAFTLPFIVMLYEFSFFGRPGFRRLVSLAPMLLTGVIIPLSMLNIHKPIGEVLSDVSKVTMVQTTLPRWEYLCTQFSVIATYLRLLFLPIHQNLDYDYPINHSLVEPRAILALFLLLAIFSAAIILWRRSRHGGEPGLRLAAFGIFWFFITLVVESSVIPIVDVIFEHRVYLPSAGFFIALVTLAAIGVERLRPRMPMLARLQLPLLVVVAVLLGGATYARNGVWQDPVSIWGDTMAKSPEKARPAYNLGVILAQAGRDEEAIGLFRRAIQLAPDKVEAYNNLGAALEKRGDFNEAAEMFSQALGIKPDHAEALYNLGRLYLQDLNMPQDAVLLFARAIALKPDYLDAQINLSAAYNRLGQYKETVRLLEQVNKTVEDRADSHNNLAIAYTFLGNTSAAWRELDAVRRLDPPMAKQLEDFMIPSRPGGGR
jgi:tetratricopeptide (TPR) repeat protein